MRLAAIIVLLAPAIAVADPSFEVIDRGNAVEVIAHDVTAAKTSIAPIRSRLEIPLVGHPRAPRIIPIDSTVKEIEFDGDTQRVFSVKTGFEHVDVVRLAKFAQAMQVGPDVHIMFPRTIPAEGAAIVLPEPTLTPAIAARVAAAKTPEAPKAEAPKAEAIALPNLAAEAAKAPAPKTETAPVVEKPADKPIESAKPVEAAKPIETKPATKPATIAASKTDDPWQKLSMYGAIGLAAIGCGVWMLRKRKANGLPVSTIDVIAQKSLGGKAKVVWFTAGGREMVVSVTPQSVRMLGQWKKTTTTETSVMSPLPRAQTHADDKPAASSAVSGILKLRERASTQSMAAIADDMSEDVDQAWAREILAATGARK